MKNRRAKWLRWLAVAFAGALVGGGTVWAMDAVLVPPTDPLESEAHTFTQVVRGEVGSGIALNVVAEWEAQPLGANLAAGVVTATYTAPGQLVSAGAPLYDVNLRPVTIAQGSVPAFRPLGSGDSGADVAQLQHLLAVLGYYTYEVDGKFDWVTEQAVREWQTARGLESTGSVQAGDIIYVPELPIRIALDEEKVKRGATVNGGEMVVDALPPAPVFFIPVTEAQAAMMPNATEVNISGPSGQPWTAVVSDQQAADGGTIKVLLAGINGAQICADQCELLSVTEQTLLRSEVITVKSTEGLVLPSAALLSRADGALVVIDDDGVEHVVTVGASARGMSVVLGVEEGMRVRLPSADE